MVAFKTNVEKKLASLFKYRYDKSCNLKSEQIRFLTNQMYEQSATEDLNNLLHPKVELFHSQFEKKTSPTFQGQFINVFQIESQLKGQILQDIPFSLVRQISIFIVILKSLEFQKMTFLSSKSTSTFLSCLFFIPSKAFNSSGPECSKAVECRTLMNTGLYIFDGWVNKALMPRLNSVPKH